MLNVPQEVKDLLHLDTCQKNIRIHFPNGERQDICNDLIVKDSVKFTESLCSQDELKFGLSEASVFECETVGVGNIKGTIIEVSCEVFCDSTVTGAEWKNDLMAYVYAIPYGTFYVDTSKRQADMNHRRITAYSNMYHSIFDNGQNDSPMAYYANQIVSSSSNFSTSIEELIFTTYPDLFDKEIYPHTSNDLMSLGVYSESLTDTIYQDDEVKVRLSFYQTSLSVVNGTTIGIVDLDAFEINPTFNDEIEAGIAEIGQRYHLTDAEVVTLRHSIYQELDQRIDKPYVSLYREDRVPPSSTHTPTYIIKAGQVVVFNGHSSNIHNLKLVIDCNWDRIPTFSKTIKYCKDNTAYIHKILASDMTKHSYSLERKADGYDVMNIWPAEGYSARLAYQSLNIMEIASAYIEAQGLFVMYGRDDNAKYVNIRQQFGLLPASNLYPSGSLYPEGVTGGRLLPDDYQSCWYDDEYTKPFGAVICDYKDGNNKEKSYILFLTGYDSTTPNTEYKVYQLSGNAYINMFTWTKAQIQAICETIASNIEGVAYMPVDFVGRGLPYVEAGDTFEILTKSNDSITTIVLNRTISGEQTLTDSYKSV